MEQVQPAFEKYIFVCENEREFGDFCGTQGTRVRELLKNTIKDRGLSKQVRVSRSGCLDVCAQGPNVLIVPDYVWFNRVTEQDVPEIINFVLGRLK